MVSMAGFHMLYNPQCSPSNVQCLVYGVCRVISELQLRRDPGAGHGAAEAREVVMELSLIPAINW